METFVASPGWRNWTLSAPRRWRRALSLSTTKRPKATSSTGCPTARTEIYIYVLLEFQSTVEYWMVLRMLNYITNFYMDWVKAHPEAKKLPVVFPILLYNGDAQWTAATELAAVMSHSRAGRVCHRLSLLQDSRERVQPGAVVGHPEHRLHALPGGVAAGHQPASGAVVGALRAGEDKQAISLFLNWYRQLAVHGRVKEEDYASLAEVYRSAEEVQGMLQKTFAQQQERWYLEGREEGREKGREEGIEKGREEGMRKAAALLRSLGRCTPAVSTSPPSRTSPAWTQPNSPPSWRRRPRTRCLSGLNNSKRPSRGDSWLGPFLLGVG
jgi:hypothetical protein